ncbi:predicted protein [Lichtheimia corymbifera JMRC:FSU:9682]|uniref:Uncharacterized protein n=1 Tax=Lichtheimia corymbifera JMRC:FSU:9682 TaxID=1263082 RepID=A0A068S7Q5_9FUNG|nr:predicted protein [Lichtheimia corymbifera JMRC:FSU:9682]
MLDIENVGGHVGIHPDQLLRTPFALCVGEKVKVVIHCQDGTKETRYYASLARLNKSVKVDGIQLIRARYIKTHQDEHLDATIDEKKLKISLHFDQ